MISTLTSKLIFRALIMALCLTGLCSLDATAQTCTQSNSPPVNKSGWLKGTTVQVYIDPSIPGPDPVTGQDQRGAVIQAFNNWSAASGSNGNNSGVTYTIVNSPPSGSNTFTVTSGTLSGLRGDTTSSLDAYGHTVGARTTIDSRVTDPAAILEVMAHEIGHPAGFGDCTSCAPADSVMALGATDYNQVLGRPTSPSQCDNQALQQTDYPPCNPPVNTSDCLVWDPNTCTCSQYSGGGGGGYEGDYGGGGYYDPGCTDYYWVWYVSYDGGQTWEPTGEIEYAGCY